MDLITVAYLVFRQVIDNCSRKRPAPDPDWPVAKRPKFNHVFTVEHKVDYSKTVLQKFTASREDRLLDFEERKHRSVSDLKERIQALEFETAQAKAELKALEESSITPRSTETTQPPSADQQLFESLELPELTEAEMEQLASLWSQPSSDEVLIIIENLPVKCRDLKTLKPPSWLNDEVVNACVALMPVDGGTIILNSFFFTMICQQFSAPEVNSSKIMRILRKRGFTGGTKRLLFPINLERAHWLCAEVDLKKRIVTTYDSLGSSLEPGVVVAQVLGKVLNKNLKVVGGHSPRQENGYDCGVFMIANLSLLASQQPLEYSQIRVNRFREVLAVRIARGRWDLRFE